MDSENQEFDLKNEDETQIIIIEESILNYSKYSV